MVSFQTMYVVCEFSVNLWLKLLGADIRPHDCVKIKCMDPRLNILCLKPLCYAHQGSVQYVIRRWLWHCAGCANDVNVRCYWTTLVWSVPNLAVQQCHHDICQLCLRPYSYYETTKL